MAPKKSIVAAAAPPGGGGGRKSSSGNNCNPTLHTPQRSIASFFSPSPSPPLLPLEQSSAVKQNKKKPLLVVGAATPTPDGPLQHQSIEEFCSGNGRLRNLEKALNESSPVARSLDEERACIPDSSRGEPGVATVSTNVSSRDLALDISNPFSLVGKHVSVYWPLDDAWYDGCIKDCISSTGKCLHVVQYDDGEEETLNLEAETFKVLPGTKRRKLRKLNRSSPCITLEKGLSVDGEHRNTLEEKEETCSSRPKRSRPTALHTPEDAADEVDEKDVEWTMSGGEAEAGGNCGTKAHGKPGTATEYVPPSKRARKAGDVSAEANDQLPKPVGKHCKNHVHSLETSVTPQICKDPAVKRDRMCDDSCQGEAGAFNIQLSGEAAERFGHRNADKFKFLDKYRKDALGRRPGDPEYDPQTLHLPTEFLKGLSACQRQWWEIKSKHMDKVLLFKMGKFYEMFEMDAHVGAQDLDLQYMKGDQPHCGFPEKNFEENAGKLARLGYRVLVVEQVETPQQLEERNIKSGTKDKVVKRDICAVITKGTITDRDMLGPTPDATYLMTAYEIPDNGSLAESSIVGLCFLDAATSRFILGQFQDDMARTRLRSVLSALRPVELVKPRGLLASATEKALREQTRNALVTNLTPGSDFWNSARTVEEIVGFYWSKHENREVREDSECQDKMEFLPALLRILFKAGDKGKAATCALGGCISYLRHGLLDQRLLSSGRFEVLPGSQLPVEEMEVSDKAHRLDTFNLFADHTEPFMVLDSSALENLDILENSCDGSTSGTLLAQLDHCVTAAGRRLLKHWIVRPLMLRESILDRQNAIDDMQVAFAEASKFRRELARLPDMERLVVRLHACNEQSGRDAQAVVLYEDASRKLLKEFIGALCGFQTVNRVLSYFTGSPRQFKSRRLQRLLCPGEGFPDLSSVLQFFETAFDWAEAERTGRISPHKDVDSEFDFQCAKVSAVEKRLMKYLEDQRELFGNQSIEYVTVGKDRYQIEVADFLQKKVPSDYEAMSQRKGFRRFSTPQVRELLKELMIEEDKKEIALKNILQGLLKRFCKNHAIWLHFVRIVAELDALMSLSVANESLLGVTCKPVISDAEASSRVLLAKSLRHPILEGSLDGGSLFVPNDVSLGHAGRAPFMLLTGPNMGGKSTLLRQVCLAVILAQIGARVPAESFQFSPVDRIFVRMGAKDNIMATQSTFLVELTETACMLTSATRDSLVALDELGRGTATSDGQAIAHAVLEHLARQVGCRGMFSTHYHRLADEHANDAMVSLYHMACSVDVSNGVENVTFLYKLAPGTCPKSYGVNVARIAGMPDSVLKRAASRAAEIEAQEREGRNRHYETKLFFDILQSVSNISSFSLHTKHALDILQQYWKQAKQLLVQ